MRNDLNARIRSDFWHTVPTFSRWVVGHWTTRIGATEQFMDVNPFSSHHCLALWPIVFYSSCPFCEPVWSNLFALASKSAGSDSLPLKYIYVSTNAYIETRTRENVHRNTNTSRRVRAVCSVFATWSHLISTRSNLISVCSVRLPFSSCVFPSRFHFLTVFVSAPTNFRMCSVYVPVFPFHLQPQHDVPPGKHALITVRQPKGNLVWVQTQTTATAGQAAKQNDKEKKFQPHISTWDECDSVQVILWSLAVGVVFVENVMFVSENIFADIKVSRA